MVHCISNSVLKISNKMKTGARRKMRTLKSLLGHHNCSVKKKFNLWTSWYLIIMRCGPMVIAMCLFFKESSKIHHSHFLIIFHLQRNLAVKCNTFLLSKFWLFIFFLSGNNVYNPEMTTIIVCVNNASFSS